MKDLLLPMALLVTITLAIFTIVASIYGHDIRWLMPLMIWLIGLVVADDVLDIKRIRS